MSIFSDVQHSPPIETFKLTEAYCRDESPLKVNLDCLGTIKTEDGKPFVMPIVAQMERKVNGENYEKSFEYHYYFGDEEFSNCAGKLLLGEKLLEELKTKNLIVMAQTVGATGTLRVGGEFLIRHTDKKTLLIPSPTWGNHRSVFQQAGFRDIRDFYYYDYDENEVDFDRMTSELMTYPDGCIIVLHVCCHNPSGADLTKEQWMDLELLCKAKSFLPFFDCCYQGLASGDPDDDAWSVRYFISRGHEVLCAQSFAKNFTLYNERVGNLIITNVDSSTKLNIERQLAIDLRCNWNNPNIHGSRIVKMILSDHQLKTIWKTELRNVYLRLEFLKRLLFDNVCKRGGDAMARRIRHILRSKGMFSYLPLSGDAILRLETKWHIYLQKDGRVNFFGINEQNVEHIADAVISELSLN